MGKVYESIDADILRWVDKQHMFFVATAPLTATGSVNLSPKGNDTLQILDEHTLVFLDSGGSGIETIAHVRENKRIVIMMCAFEGPPKIYRFHGEGEVIVPSDARFEKLANRFDRTQIGIRALIVVHVQRISDSCGYGVPFYSFENNRPSTANHLKKSGVEPVRDYLAVNNLESIDGIAGLTAEEAHAFKGPVDDVG